MSDTTVTAADQALINKFARIHQNNLAIKEEMAQLAADLQNLNEAADELMLLDDDTESVPMKIGNTFIHFDQDTMSSKLDDMKDETVKKLDDDTRQKESLEAEMEKLKATLYGKFGDRINLETDKDE